VFVEAFGQLTAQPKGKKLGFVYGRQLEALWVISKPSSGMTDLLGHALGQT
jgi:hypothetical protein